MLKSIESQLKQAKAEFDELTQQMAQVAAPYQSEIDELYEQIAPTLKRINALKAEGEAKLEPLNTQREQVRGKYTAFFKMFVATKNNKPMEEVTDEELVAEQNKIDSENDKAEEVMLEDVEVVDVEVENDPVQEVADQIVEEIVAEAKQEEYTLTPEEIAKLEASMKKEEKPAPKAKVKQEDIPDYLKEEYNKK